MLTTIEMYLELCQTSVIEFFENSERFVVVIYFFVENSIIVVWQFVTYVEIYCCVDEK